MSVAFDKAIHVHSTIFIDLIFLCLNLGQGPHRVQNNLMQRRKLNFLDSEKLAHNRRQAVKVVAVQACLLVEELDLVQSEIVLNEIGIDAHIDMIGVFCTCVEHTGQEDTSLLFLDHLHEEFSVADFLNRMPVHAL